MKLFETAKALVNNKEIQEVTKDIIEDLVSGFLGDPLAIGRVIYTLSQYPFLIREQIFWTKFSAFLNGACLDDNELIALNAKLEIDGNNKDNAYRIMACIDRVETEKKVNYLVNVTKHLIKGIIDVQMYFRICNIISNTLEEDLNFLHNKITDKDISYSPQVQGLLTVGLMYQSVFDSYDSDQKYSFNSLAAYVDEYALNPERIDLDANKCVKTTNEKQQISIYSSISEKQFATNEEIEEMLHDVFDK